MQKNHMLTAAALCVTVAATFLPCAANAQTMQVTPGELIGQQAQRSVSPLPSDLFGSGEMTVLIELKRGDYGIDDYLLWQDETDGDFLRIGFCPMLHNQVVYPQRSTLFYVLRSFERPEDFDPKKFWLRRMDNSYAGFVYPLNPSSDRAADEIIYRKRGELSELYVNGHLVDSRNYMRGGTRVSLDYQHAYTDRPDGFSLSGSLAEKVTGRGVLVWDRALSDPELAEWSSRPIDRESYAAHVPKQERGYHDSTGTLLPQSLSDEEKYAMINRNLDALVETLSEKDPYFPQFHFAMPFLAHDPKAFSFRDTVVFYPAASYAWYGLTGPRDLLEFHATTKDFSEWDLNKVLVKSPVNNAYFSEIDGTAVRPLGKTAGMAETHQVAEDDSFETFRTSSEEIEVPPPPGSFEDVFSHGQNEYFMFEEGGERWLLVNPHFTQNQHLLLIYRAVGDSFKKWEYHGVFYEGNLDTPGAIECVQIFKMGDHYGLVHFGNKSFDQDGSRFLVGDIVDGRFIKLAGVDKPVPGLMPSGVAFSHRGKTYWVAYGTWVYRETLEQLAHGWNSIFPFYEIQYRDGRMHVSPPESWVDLRRQEEVLARDVAVTDSFAADFEASAAFEIEMEVDAKEAASIDVKIRNDSDVIPITYDSAERTISLFGVKANPWEKSRIHFGCGFSSTTRWSKSLGMTVLPSHESGDPPPPALTACRSTRRQVRSIGSACRNGI